MKDMKQTITNIENASEHIKEVLRERISFVIEHDLDGLLEAMSDDPMYAERCFGPEVASLLQSWSYLTITAGELFEVNDAREEVEAMSEAEFRQAMRYTKEGKVIPLDPFSHPDEEEYNF
tara:strand:- start:195 stop:554 length:360 start_codon:yes stop_codon:yes gene_type:complete